jgi:UDP-N-acetylglucosamine acyltransferase
MSIFLSRNREYNYFMTIHSSAIIDREAEVDSSVSVGAYAVIEEGVRIGAGTRVEPHAVITGMTTIGTDNVIGSFTSIGTPPQDIGYGGEPTQLIIGNNNQIREYTSIHRGTVKGGGKTMIGNNNLFMAYCHIGHDCHIADHVIMANVATLAGHVEVDDHVSISGLVAVHQFCRIGAYAYIGGMSGISLDVAPYMIVTGTRSRMRVSGLNKVGLKRHGFTKEMISKLDQAFRILFRSPELLQADALLQVRQELPDCAEVETLVRFIESSKRGVAKRTED